MESVGNVGWGRMFEGLGTKRVTWLIVIAGIALRVGFLACGRPVWLDEASLGLDVMRKSVREVVLRGAVEERVPGAPAQVYPAGYFAILKAAQALGGAGPVPLRCVSLLSGALLLCLGGVWLRKELPGASANIALLLLAFSGALVEYSTEIKPYEWEAVVAVALLLAMGPPIECRAGRIGWIALGLPAPWFSFSAVWVLLGAWLAAQYRAIPSRSANALIAGAIILGCWAGSWAFYYLAALKAHCTNPDLLAFHSGAFAPFPPTSMGDVKWYLDSCLLLVEGVLGWDFRFAGLGAVLGVAGGFALWKEPQSWRSSVRCGGPVRECVTAVPAVDRLEHRRDACVTLSAAARSPGLGWKERKQMVLGIIGTIGIVVAASALRKYPWAPRLLMFLAPGVAALVGTGIAVCLRRIAGVSRIGVALSLLGLGWVVGGSSARPIRAEAAREGFKYRDVAAMVSEIERVREKREQLYVFKP